MKKTTLWALLSGLCASIIYGINHTVAKVLMPEYIGPFGFIFVRVSIAGMLFWLVSLFLPQEKVVLKDFKTILFAAFFGMGLNMLSFFYGLNLSTPINSAVIITIAPIVVLILSFFLLKEKISFLNLLGIIVGFLGAFFLIISNKTSQTNAPNIPLGNVFFLINSSSFAFYLILIKPLTSKYNTITLMKWLFLFGFIIDFPVTVGEFLEIKWISMPWEALWRIGFVVLGTTFFTYLLNMYALKHLSSTVVSSFIYIQPIIGIGFAVFSGVDTIETIEIIAAILVFIGVYWVNKKKKKNYNKKKVLIFAF